MRKFTITATLCVMFGLLAVGQAFAMDSWIDHKSTKTPDTTGDCYQIKSAGDLAWYANFVNNQGQHAVSCAELQSDIDLGGKFWVPISYKGVRHKVNFNGNGFIISNLYINAEYLLDKYPPPATGDHAAQNLGLIGAFEGHVQNVILENVEIYGYGRNFATAGKDPIKNPLSIGTVVGWQTTKTSVVENCYVTGKIVTSGDGQAVGGIVGNNGGGTIRNCYSAVNIDASGVAYVGGIAGYTKAYEGGTVTISSCVYNGETLSSTGSGEAGAIVGNHLDGSTTFENVYYDSTKFEEGVGASMGGSISGSPSGTDNLNSELIASTLNEGTEDNPWSSGESDVCLNGYGADGHKVTFDANGGSFAGGTTYVKYVQHGNIINNDGVADPTWANDDYVFAGWSGDAYMAPASKAVTISAAWNPVYTITFDAAPGTFPNEASGVVKTVKVESGKKIAVKDFVVPSFYTNQGVKYSFMGWSTNKTPKEEDALVDENGLDDLPIATDNITLHAVWTEATIYTVTFDANGHGPSIANYVKVKNVYDQEKTTALTDDDFEHAEGYSLDTENGSGWCIDSECSAEFNFNTPIEENKTLYAKWKAKEYTITYENLNGASNSNPSKYTVDGLVLADPSWNAAHRFLGWYKDSEFKNKVTNIPAGSTGNLTLYAKWEDVTYTITYRGGSYGIGLVPSETKIHGQSYTLRDTSYTRKGYTQTGWATDTNGAKVYEFGATYEENAALTLYPSWSDPIVYTITYVCDGCVNDPSNRDNYTIETSTFSVKFKDLTPPDGYSMVGWYTATDYKTKVEQIKKGSFGDTTLYAKLNKIYNITYVGTDKPYGDKTYTSEKAAQLRTCASREGYTFAGWYDNPAFAGNSVTEVPLGSTGDKTFYAKWIIKKGAITIVDNLDGTNSAVINGNYGGGDEPNSEEADAVEIISDIAVNSVTLNRTFNAGKIATLYVPFEIDAENVVGTEVYKFKTVVKSDVDNRWKFKVATATKVMPNTPYVIIPEGTQVTFDITAPVTLNTTTEGEATAANSWEFVGAYQYEKFTLDNNKPVYLFADQARDGAKLGEFVKIADGAYINPMRAYLVYHKTLAKSARGNLGSNILLPDELDIEIENENGIVVQTGTLNTVTGEVRMDRWFDLKGRKLNSKPTVKGTYYKNGKRVIVK